MGTVIVVDSWLIDLAGKGEQYRKPAYVLAKAQLELAKNTGHMLSYSDPYIRRKLIERLEKGSMPGIMVRCLRCEVWAHLRDWIKASGWSDEQRFALWSEMSEKHGLARAQFLKPCPGEFVAAAVIGQLRDLAEEE